jgi:PPOX class probable F420-dependent enzyme
MLPTSESAAAWRRVRGHIAWDWFDRNLRASRSIWLATARPDGRPHAMPLWFWWDGESAYFITSVRTQKHRNLEHGAAVALHLGDGDDAIILEGVAEQTTDPDELDRLDRGYRAKYVDPYTGAEASIHDNPEDRIYRVTPIMIMGWMYGVIGTRTDWRRADGAAR